MDGYSKTKFRARSIFRMQISKLMAAYWIILLILWMGSSSCSNIAPLACGLDPETERMLMLGARARMGIDSIGNIVPEPFGKLEVELCASYPMGRLSAIYIKIGSATGDSLRITSTTWYCSTDHGESWQRLPRPLAGHSGLAVLGGSAYWLEPQDSQNPSLLYANEPADRCRFKISRDAGVSWIEIQPAVNAASKPRWFQIIGGYDNGKRIYARVGLEGDPKDFCLYRSLDGGKTFSLLSCDVTRAVESRASNSVMIGYLSRRMLPTSGLAISNDGGYVWHKVNSKVLTEPLATYPGEDSAPIFRTWAEKGDRTVEPGTAISQIETDPMDVNTFYVVTWKGLYATRDQGKTFRLLPLATEWLMGIDNIAIDPTDGRYLFASVNMCMLYRSADRGCSWTKLKVPGQ